MTESDILSKRWKDISARLGIVVQAPYEEYISGIQVKASARLPDFGAPKGMLLFSSFDQIGATYKEISESGFGYSVLSASDDDIDEDSVVEILRDWGWRSAAKSKPSWL